MKKVVLITLILSILILAGCGSLIDLKASSEVIKNFLTENPDADITMNTWSTDDVRDNQDKITLICGKMLEEKPYYYVLIEEKEQKIEAFLDFDSGKAVCVKRVGLKDDVREICSELDEKECLANREYCDPNYGPSNCQPNGLCTADIVFLKCDEREDKRSIDKSVCGNGVCDELEKNKDYCKPYFEQKGNVLPGYPSECEYYCPKDCGEIIDVPQEKINEEQAIELVKQYFHKQWYQVSDGCGKYNEKTGMMEAEKVYVSEKNDEAYLIIAETYCGYYGGAMTKIEYAVTLYGNVYEKGRIRDYEAEKKICEEKSYYWNECPMQTCPAGQACIQVCGEPICEENPRHPIELPPPGIIKETIKCVFKNSNQEQKCYSEEFSCSGTEACNVEVKGEYGKTLTWKSSCGGYAYTKLDGRGEYAEFECSSSTTSSQCSDYRNPVCGIDGETYQNICVAESNNVKIAYYGECENAVSEKVTCIFAHPSLENKCYSVDGLWSCSGEEKCDASVKGGKGTKITWKSKCTETQNGQTTYGVGYADTMIDGQDETASFACTINTQIIID